jgi:oligopeptide/dipeptide ABC transporter ATP-binding protein|tara:strand:- start:475 stop:1491 length:1017 start_codon:yes stop_codon:yes gene_type:complete
MLGEINKNYLLQVKKLSKVFEIRDAALRKRTIKAVDGVSFVINNKETFAIVGESGSGKSTIGRILLGLTDKTAGEIFFDGKPLQIQNHKNSIPLRRRLQIVFQDPTASFDPRLKILDSLLEFLELRQGLNSEDQIRLAKELVVEVGLDTEMINRKPSEMSGGQLQRLNIARALASGPDLIFLDEPTSSLDVSIRGQIVNLLLEKQEKYGITFLLVAHDLRVVAVMADRVAVMYLGQFVEICEKEKIFSNPLHPYTRGLIQAARIDDLGLKKNNNLVRLSGELKEDDIKSAGCRLTSRCPFYESKCNMHQDIIELRPGQWVRCWKALEVENSNSNQIKE